MASPDFSNRGRGASTNPGRGRPLSKNKQWVANEGPPRAAPDGERWERGGHHGRARGRGVPRGGPRKFPNATLRNTPPTTTTTATTSSAFKSPPEPTRETHVAPYVDDEPLPEIHEPVLETQEERDRFWQELVAAREQERKQAIAEGKMDDPLVPKRLEDAISIVGTCPDMCPRFERYRRERENNLFEFETIPGTKRIDHRKAVKIYERAAGDKTIPSDLRPPRVLKKTLDYLFHDLLSRDGMHKTTNFIRDRSRAVRNDFTMQHLTGRAAIECHDRCARFHILAIHLERQQAGFSIPLEEQQLMNTLQSLKEFYEDQRHKYQSPTELEMRVYHRLIHIRDQKERPENIPEQISNHPVFKLVTQFRLHVQQKSAPITKVSKLVVDAQGMQIFGQLVGVLREQGNTVMIYLVACILERLFGPETIDDIEAIRGDLTLSDIIDGRSDSVHIQEEHFGGGDEEMEDYLQEDEEQEPEPEPEPEPFHPPNNLSTFPSSFVPQPPQPNSFNVPASSVPPQKSAFASLVSTSTPNVFGTSVFGVSSTPNVFGAPAPSSSSSTPAPQFPQPTSAQPSSTFSQASTSLSLPPSTSQATAPQEISNSQPSTSSNIVSFPPFPTGSMFSQPKSEAPTPTPPSFFSAPTTSQAPSTNGAASKPSPSLNPQAASFTPPSSFFQQPPPRQQQPQSSLFGLPPAQSQTETMQEKPTFANAPPLGTSPAPIISRLSVSGSSSISRTATPPPLKIDTTPAIPSPQEPPTLGKVQPISLPSTPTTAPPPSALLHHLKSNLRSQTEVMQENRIDALLISRQQTSWSFFVKRTFVKSGRGFKLNPPHIRAPPAAPSRVLPAGRRRSIY